jgi:hypothetical protein
MPYLMGIASGFVVVMLCLNIVLALMLVYCAYSIVAE